MILPPPRSTRTDTLVPDTTLFLSPTSVATGSIATGGTLGILIPPSVTMIVYGISTQTSIGRLFLAGVLPGLMLTTMFMAWALLDARRKGFSFHVGTVSYSLRDKLVTQIGRASGRERCVMPCRFRGPPYP